MTDDLAGVVIRDEQPGDWDAVSNLITLAFAPMPFSDDTEAALVTSLRQSGATVVALVAEQRLTETCPCLGSWSFHTSLTHVNLTGSSAKVLAVGDRETGAVAPLALPPNGPGA